MPTFLSSHEYSVLEAACDCLIPPAGDFPGGRALAAADYIDGLLGAFLVDPPRIWAGGPFSGRHGGEPGFGRFLELGPLEELAWRTRIEGSRGLPERERNGPTTGLQELYRTGLAALGNDFTELPPDEQQGRLDAQPAFAALLYQHACEGAYAAPEYGGNRGTAGWSAIEYPGDVQPRGYTDDEVAGRP
jgi:hypothetical protein